MKDGKLIKVTIESPDGNATVTMRQAPLNKQLEQNELVDLQKERSLTPAEIRRLYELFASNVVSVEGIEGADGQPVTVDDFRALNISFDTILAITSALGRQQSPKESDEKKSTAADS